MKLQKKQIIITGLVAIGIVGLMLGGYAIVKNKQTSDVILGANNGWQGDGTFDILGNGTSTVAYGLEVALKGGNVAIGGTSTTTLRGNGATSTFSNGITLAGGCFRDAAGACALTSSAGILTVDNWTFLSNYGANNLTPSSTIPVWLRGNTSVSGTLYASGNITSDGRVNMTYSSSTALTATYLFGNGAGITGVLANAGGSDTQVQFNDGGTTLNGDAGMVYDKTLNTLTVTYASSTALTATTLFGTSIQSPGSDTQCVFNDGGFLGGDAGCVYAKATDKLTVAYASSTAISAPTIFGTTLGSFTGILEVTGLGCEPLSATTF